MKVAQEIDVDNVTIIINPQNKLEAKIPTSTPSEVVIEEVPNVTPVNAVVTLGGVQRGITKLGKVSGTEWLVFQLGKPEQPSVTDTEWTADLICEENPPFSRYDETFTGVRLGGNLPEGITTVVITKANGQTQSFSYSGTDYKYNVNFEGFDRSGENPVAVDLITPQGNVSKPVHGICTFTSLPD